MLGLSEWELLERYLDRRDEVAFEALVARHGPMVLAVCRRMLFDPSDVDDAFQATFLVLVRRARHLGPGDAIGPWLHGVATRVALKARCDAARRRQTRPMTTEMPVSFEDRTAANRELADLLDEELSRLPSKYRHPIVLCCLEGQTHEEAARQLRWPLGTVKGRLSRARNLLQSRLARRGIAPSASALLLALSSDSAAALHRELLDHLIRSTVKLAQGPAHACVISASITSLVEGVLTTMFLNTIKWAGVAALVCGLALTGVGVMARQDAPAKKDAVPPAAKNLADKPEPETPAGEPADPIASPSPDPRPAAVRLEELRKNLLKAASAEWVDVKSEYIRLNPGPDRAYQASRRLMDAQLALASTTPAEKVSRAKEHFDRIRELARILQQKARPSSEPDNAQLEAYAAEASLWLAQAKAQAGNTNEPGESNTIRGHSDEPGKDPKSKAILAKLDMPLTMSFTDDTPLEDVLSYIKTSTATEGYEGIPIYVDPLGLQEAEKSMTSTVRNMNVKGVPLRRTLQLLLQQLDLVYFVEDGVLCITSSESEGTFRPAIHEPSPLEVRLKKAERGELTTEELEELAAFLKTRKEVMKLGDEHQTETGTVGEGPPRETEEAKQNKILVELLVKQTRELIDLLSAAKQTKKEPEKKAANPQ